MKKVWIVVANASSSKIYNAQNTTTLVEIHALEHPESHLTNHDLVSDKPGRGTDVFANPHYLQRECSPKLKEKWHFAEEIAAYIEKGFNEGKFERLYLIANPPFIGQIKEHLNSNILKTIQAEIQKDLMLQSPNQVRDYLPPVL